MLPLAMLGVVCAKSKSSNGRDNLTEVGDIITEIYAVLPSKFTEWTESELQAIEIDLSSFLDAKVVKHSMKIIRAIRNGNEQKLQPDVLESVKNSIRF